MRIARAYKVTLDPNDAQRTAFAQHAGAARWAYNWGLATWKRLYEEQKTEVTATKGEKIGKVTDAMDLHKRLNVLKRLAPEEGGVPWMYETSKCAPQESLRDLERAYKNTFRRLSEGKKGGFPKFKSKHKSRKSFRLTGSILVKSNKIKLPVIGWVRLAEQDYVPADVSIKSVTLSEKAGRWFVSVLVETEEVAPNLDGSVIGVDLGVNALATCSDGTVYENPKALNQMSTKTKSLSKRMARQEKGSNRRKKTKLKLARAHARASNIRADAIHKMTTEIVKTKRPSVIVLEDLNVSGMVKNHCLARSVSDAAFGEARRQFEYKALWGGATIVLAHKFFPSTKRCSACGVVKAEMGLGERVFVCESCGFTAGRDENASYNLRNYPSLDWKPKFTASSAGSLPLKEGGRSARGGDVRPRRLRSTGRTSLKREVDSKRGVT